jgi:hypothetical protein
MTIIRTDPTIQDITGRFGGVYYHRDKTGLHISTMPKTVKYNKTGAQLKNKNNFCNLIGIWVGMSLVLKLLWALFAKRWPLTKNGLKRFITGFNWFLKWNMIMLKEGNPITMTPPSDYEMGKRQEI